MATRYYITPYNPILWIDENSSGVESTLAINFSDFSQAAQAEWSTYKSYPRFSWSISFEGGVEVYGGFRGAGNQILALEGWDIRFNRFVVWYRSYISSEYQLFLFAEESWNALELTNETTDTDVGQFTGYE
jgi:hypothetical protein